MLPQIEHPFDDTCSSGDGEMEGGDEDEEDDFEEVPDKEGLEERIPDHLREEYGLVKKPAKPPTSR